MFICHIRKESGKADAFRTKYRRLSHFVELIARLKISVQASIGDASTATCVCVCVCVCVCARVCACAWKHLASFNPQKTSINVSVELLLFTRLCFFNLKGSRYRIVNCYAKYMKSCVSPPAAYLFQVSRINPQPRGLNAIPTPPLAHCGQLTVPTALTVS